MATRLAAAAVVALMLAGLGLTAAIAANAATAVAVTPETQITVDAPEWRELAAAFARQPDVVATFEERRFFPFKKEPVAVNGVARVSRARGLSLHYSLPEERVVILDGEGVLVRDAAGKPMPVDPRAEAGQRALLQVLRLDLAGLQKDFDVHGRTGGVHGGWALALVPKAEALRRGIGTIHVAGEGAEVKTIELRRSAKQGIEIALTVIQAPAKFSDEDVRRFFR